MNLPLLLESLFNLNLFPFPPMQNLLDALAGLLFAIVLYLTAVLILSL